MKRIVTNTWVSPSHSHTSKPSHTHLSKSDNSTHISAIYQFFCSVHSHSQSQLLVSLHICWFNLSRRNLMYREKAPEMWICLVIQISKVPLSKVNAFHHLHQHRSGFRIICVLYGWAVYIYSLCIGRPVWLLQRPLLILLGGFTRLETICCLVQDRGPRKLELHRTTDHHHTTWKVVQKTLRRPNRVSVPCILCHIWLPLGHHYRF
jgi:hypothetical protein